MQAKGFTVVAETSQCIACHSAINPGARICKECGKYQSQWRNELIYLGSIVGSFIALASVAISAFFFVGSKVQELSGPNIEIIKFTAADIMVAANKGGANGIITNVDYGASLSDGTNFDNHKTLYVELKPDEVKRIDLQDKKSDTSGSRVDMETLFLCEYEHSLHDLIHPIVYAENDPEYEKIIYYTPNALKPVCELKVGLLGAGVNETKNLPCTALLGMVVSTKSERYSEVKEKVDNGCN